jgi:uncharacterized protein YhdP
MRWIVRLLLAVLVLLLLAWVTVHYFIVPRISDFRPRLESMASSALGVPVRVGEIEARSGGMVPSFELRDVRLFDAQGRETLRLPRVLASLSAGSLLRLDFDQLFIDEPSSGSAAQRRRTRLCGRAAIDQVGAGHRFAGRRLVLRPA